MKLIHTADWHLGKYLEGESRLDEQAAFLEDFIKLTKTHDPDCIVIAGDVYDTPNPPSKAEMLFYETLKQLSEGGRRLIVVIAGNHDHPDRLTAAGPLAMEHGILMFGLPKSRILSGRYGQHEVKDIDEGVCEINIRGERTVIAAVAYPSEKRLNEALFNDSELEIDRAMAYGERLKALFDERAKYFSQETNNLLVSHLFAMNSQEAGSERGIQLGGSFMIGAECFPEQAQYIALGHVHKPQVVPGTQKRARYSGSPLHYNRKEAGQEKVCLLVEMKPNEAASVIELPLPVYKPIEVWRASSFEMAISMCEAAIQRPCWVYLEIESDTWIREDQIKALKQLKPDLLEIKPLIKSTVPNEVAHEALQELSFKELFERFYLQERQTMPNDDLMALLEQVLSDSEEEVGGQ